MKIKKAVITAAGYGTRFFPLTKTIQKEMLPILNRPLVDYVVEDCIQAGVEEIIFVVKERDSQLEKFYSEDFEVKNYLERMGKMDKYIELENLHQKAKFKYVLQDSSHPYGTAIPLKLVEREVMGEVAFFMFMGDDFIWSKTNENEALKMLSYFEGSNSVALATFIEKPKEVLYKYGVAKTRRQNGFDYLEELVEKPKPGEEPSNLVNLSKYIFTPQIFEALSKQDKNATHNEWLITDTLTILAESNNVVVYPTSGDYLDGGFVEGWLKANITVALNDPDISESVKAFIKELI